MSVAARRADLLGDRRFRLLAGAAFLVLVSLAVPHLDATYQFLAAIAVIYAFSILSLVVLTGYVGQISLCQATFAGISAYGTAMLVKTFSVNYGLAAICGVVMAFLVGIVIGIPALRLRGILLAVVTIGVALVFDYYFFQDQAFYWFTGGISGWDFSSTTNFFAIPMDGLQHVLNAYWVELGLFVVVAVLVVNLHDSGAGRRFRAIRDSEVAAATMGVDLTRYKLLAFGLSAAIAGVGGAFFPIVLGHVSSSAFNVFYSLQFAAFATLMGIRFVPAAAMGAFFMAFVPEFISRYGHGLKYDWFNAVLGALLAVQLIFAPDGVWGENARIAERVRHLLELRRPVRVAPVGGGSE